VQDDVLIDMPPGSNAVMADTAQSGPITSSATARSTSAAAIPARKVPI